MLQFNLVKKYNQHNRHAIDNTDSVFIEANEPSGYKATFHMNHAHKSVTLQEGVNSIVLKGKCPDMLIQQIPTPMPEMKEFDVEVHCLELEADKEIARYCANHDECIGKTIPFLF